MRGGKRRHESASAAGTPRPWTFFLVSRQVSWLAGRRYPRVFPMRCRISDVKIREQLTAYSCGGSAGFSRAFARSPASLLATKSCDQVDRDGYMW